MNAVIRNVLAGLAGLALMLPAAGLAQSEKMVSSDDILKQLEKKSETPANAPTTRSFRGIRINAAGEPQPAAQPAAQAAPQQKAEPSRDVAKAAPAPQAEKPQVTVYLYFKSGSAELANDFSKKQLEAVGKALSAPALAGAHFEIGGHTDSQGSDSLNQALSEQRAAFIREQLISRFGLKPAEVEARGYGKSQPVASNDSETGRAKNRRVVIKRLD